VNKTVIALLILIFLALVANLVYVAVADRSFVDTRMLPYGLFGLLVLANVLVTVAGFLFVTKAYQKHDKSTFTWAQRGYFVTFIVIALLTIAPWFFFDVGKGKGTETRAEALVDAALILLLLGVPTALFTMAFYTEFRRISRHGGPDR
jgi:hypothetical protein